MAKTVREDIRKTKREEEKILRHEDTMEVCDKNKCVRVKKKLDPLEEQEKIADSEE